MPAIGFDADGEFRHEVQIRMFLVDELIVKNRYVLVTVGFLGVSFGFVVDRPVVELFCVLLTLFYWSVCPRCIQVDFPL